MIPVRIAGIPAQIKLVKYEEHVGKGDPNLWPDPDYKPHVYMEYEVYDQEGYKALWLEDKINELYLQDKIQEQVIEYLFAREE